MIFCCKCPPTVHFVAKKDNRLAAHNDMYGRVLFIKKVNLHNKIYYGHCLVAIAVVAAAVAAAAVKTGVARKDVSPQAVEKQLKHYIEEGQLTPSL